MLISEEYEDLKDELAMFEDETYIDESVQSQIDAISTALIKLIDILNDKQPKASKVAITKRR